MNVDLYVFNIINGYAKKSRTSDFFGIFFAKYLGYVLMVSLFLSALVMHSWQIFVVPMLAGVVAISLINETIYFFYKRKRPLEVMPVNELIEKPRNASFPSDHAAFFFALSFCLFFYSMPLAVIFIIATIFICFFRIFCGVHWPSDIVAGMMVGFICFIITAFVINAL